MYYIHYNRTQNMRYKMINKQFHINNIHHITCCFHHRMIQYNLLKFHLHNMVYKYLYISKVCNLYHKLYNVHNNIINNLHHKNININYIHHKDHYYHHHKLLLIFIIFDRHKQLYISHLISTIHFIHHINNIYQINNQYSLMNKRTDN